MLACACALAYDRDKSDSVVLRNGDRISGDIISLEFGVLTLKTDNMSTLSIEWHVVRSIASKFSFAVERIGGAKFHGMIATNADGSGLQVGSVADAVTIPMGEVERISQFSPRFWDRISGSVAVGFGYAKASEISIGSFNFNSGYRSTDIDASLNASSNISRSPAGETDRDVISSAVLFLQQGRNFWGLLASLERDKALGIDSRLLGGAGVGRRFVQTSITELTGIVALAVDEERTAGTSESHGNVEGVLGVNWRVFKFTEPKTQLNLGLAVFPSFTDHGRYRGTGDLNLSHKITGDFTLSLIGYLSYDNRPPQPTAARSDYGLTMNLGYTFGQ